MKNLLFYFPLFLVLLTSAVFISSCEKATENVAVEKALVGLWRFGEKTGSVTVDGMDFIQYATTTFGLTEEEAQEVLDDIIDDVLWYTSREIMLNGEKTYQLTIYNVGETYGTWLVSADGETLKLTGDNEVANLTILEIAARALLLRFPTGHQEVDIDGDGENETIVDINMEMTLKKNVGGAGS